MLALGLHGEFLSEPGGSPVPFTELPALGGLETMRGYLPRRFVGDSVVEATLSYRYPVWSLLHAELFAGIGNAYNGYLGIGKEDAEDFSFKRLYFDAGFGLRTSFD